MRIKEFTRVVKYAGALFTIVIFNLPPGPVRVIRYSCTINLPASLVGYPSLRGKIQQNDASGNESAGGDLKAFTLYSGLSAPSFAATNNAMMGEIDVTISGVSTVGIVLTGINSGSDFISLTSDPSYLEVELL
jgi:hypothetical protein